MMHATVSPDPMSVDWEDAVRRELDIALATLDKAGPEHFIHHLNATVTRLREAAGDAFHGQVVPEIRRHPAIAVARECPITRHTVTWPRGYPGDAGLLDQLYRHEGGVAASTDRAHRMMAAIQNSTPSKSVRHRRMLLADAIDDIAVRFPGADVLAMACGHLREVEWSAAVADGRISRLVAADQDEQSLDRIRRDYGARFPAIQPTSLSVRGVIGGRGAALGHFHLIYAAGLYDYLPTPVATSLTARLFALLHPGGRLLVGNFSDQLPESAYMESVMDWPLLWRSRDDLAALSAAIPKDNIASSRVWSDITDACIYLDITRA